MSPGNRSRLRRQKARGPLRPYWRSRGFVAPMTKGQRRAYNIKINSLIREVWNGMVK